MSFWKKIFSSNSEQISEEDASKFMIGDSSKLLRGKIPEICFVCAPFGGTVPSDLGDWAKNTQALAAASVLGIVDTNRFKSLQERFSDTKTIIVPDIKAKEVLSNNNVKGSMAHRASLVMLLKLNLIASEWEYFSMAYQIDALDRCSPVGVLFVFKR